MRKVDLFFNYKYTFRFLIINGIFSINDKLFISNLDKIILFFSINDLPDLNDTRIYNYCYFFRFFFGIKPFFTQCLDVSTFKKVGYSFSIQAILRKHDMFLAANFFFNDILPFVNSRDFSLSLNFSKESCLIYYIINNLDVFSEKKANLGLLNLQNSFNLKFYFKGCDYFSCKYLMYFFKM